MTIETVPSLQVFFRDSLSHAEQRLAVHPPAPTGEYLAELLARCAGGTSMPATQRSLVVQLDEALAYAPDSQLRALQAVGDAAITELALFPESLSHTGVDPRLYHRIGAYAYGRAASIAQYSSEASAAVLRDLEGHFPSYVALVNEVVTSSSLGATTRDLVRRFDLEKRAGRGRGGQC